jgi:hypothetical protein
MLMFIINEKHFFKKIALIEAIKIFWVAAIFVGQSERGNKQNFILGLKFENIFNRGVAHMPLEKKYISLFCPSPFLKLHSTGHTAHK